MPDSLAAVAEIRIVQSADISYLRGFRASRFEILGCRLGGIWLVEFANVECPLQQIQGDELVRSRVSRYPSHLSRLVGEQLRQRGLEPPPDKELLRLLEILYFASLKTDEKRPCRCTVNYVDPTVPFDTREDRSHWSTIPFGQPIPLSVGSLTELAEAADPAVASFAVITVKTVSCLFGRWSIKSHVSEIMWYVIE